MVDEREESMDLDLNLEPSLPPPRLPSVVLEEAFFRERIERLEEIAARSRGRWRRRWREGRLPPRSTAGELLMEIVVSAPPSSPPSLPPSVGIQRLLTGEGSAPPAPPAPLAPLAPLAPAAPAAPALAASAASAAAAALALAPAPAPAPGEERSNEICKACKGRPTHLIAKALEEKGDEDLEKESNELKVSFFDCNICFEMASDPVLTSCGHLFCWGCLYQWINVHSDTKECPVCKGEVTEMNITPIYGRGGGGSKTHEAEDKEEEEEEEEEEVKELKIPPRPHARRIESLRQTAQRGAETSFTIEELLQQYDSMFDVYRGFNRATRIPERSDVGPRLEPTQPRALNDVIDLTQDNVVVSSEVAGSSRSRVRRRPLLRPHLTTRASASYLPSSVTSGERSVESYVQGQPVRRNQSQSPSVDDRDSFSSIVAVMNSDSQTVDTAIEIDSMVSPTSSSSRRRRDTSSVSDVNRVFTRSSRRRR